MSTNPKVPLNPEDVLVRAQSTPNPKALKFISNFAFKKEGKATFKDPSQCEEHLLFFDLFLIDGMRQIYVFENSLTLTHDGTVLEDEFIQDAESIIKTRLPVHDPSFLTADEKKETKKAVDRSELPVEIQQIESILDRTVRPGLQADGGDLEVLGYENHELTITYQGACGSCPSSLMGTLQAIENILKNEFDPDIRVYPIQELEY